MKDKPYHTMTNEEKDYFNQKGTTLVNLHFLESQIKAGIFLFPELQQIEERLLSLHKIRK